MINVPFFLLVTLLFKLQKTGIKLFFLKLLNRYKKTSLSFTCGGGKEVLSSHLLHIFSLNVVLGLSVANYLATTLKQMEKDSF